MALTVVQSGVGGTGNTNLTYPSTGGTVMVSGNQPAFSAYLNTSQTLSAYTFTKITLNAEEYDTANAFDSTTNYRFTPQVAGYYQFNAAWTAGTAGTNMTVAIYKNGSEAKRGQNVQASAAIMTVSCLIYMNGSTDYAEFYATTQLGQAGATGSNLTYFQGILVRSA